MSPFGEQDFYAILEVPPDGTPQQIERAYRIVRATYRPSSLATYSILSEEESLEILRRIEEAYAVLSDARLRRDYDTRLLRARGPRPQLRGEPPDPEAEAPAPEPPEWTPPLSAELEYAEAPEDGVYDGPVLRRIRVGLGVELEEIAQMTKVNERYLEHIEANRYEDLPPPVYVKGFLREYAKSIRLDPARVIESYIEGMKTRTRKGA